MRRLLAIAALIAAGALLFPAVADAQQGIVGQTIPDNPQNVGKGDVVDVLVEIIRWLLTFAAAIGAIFVVVNGYQYILAAGNPEKIEKAKQGLTWSIVGFVLVVSAYGIVLLLQNVLRAETTVLNKVPGDPPRPQTVLEQIGDLVFTFGAAIAVLFLIIGGYRYITSQGNPELADKAKKTVLYALIGLAVLSLAKVITELTIGTIKR